MLIQPDTDLSHLQHALQTARRFLGSQDTPNRQIVLITDGLPTAHFEGSTLFLLYPPDPRTEEATMREATSVIRPAPAGSSSTWSPPGGPRWSWSI